MITPGTRVWCQEIDETTGRFGKVDKNDRGTVIQDVYHPIGTYSMTPCLAVEWDTPQSPDSELDIDEITDAGTARHWPYQVLPIPPSARIER